jgi:hypothetical protein
MPIIKLIRGSFGLTYIERFEARSKIESKAVNKKQGLIPAFYLQRTGKSECFEK